MKKDLCHLDRFLLPGMPVPHLDEADGSAWQINRLRVIASWGSGWDHVSVSLQDRCPIWEEMCWIKRQFFDPSECVMQLHPQEADYVNNHPFCLHMWKPQSEAIPTPPSWMVGTKNGESLGAAMAKAVSP